MQKKIDSSRDLANLTDLNRDYLQSVSAADTQRFDEILAEDFLCSTPDGQLLDKGEFLKQTARGRFISNLEAHDVKIRLLDNIAIVHARTTYQNRDGLQGSGRYTDVWARRDGIWLAVAAHVTRDA